MRRSIVLVGALFLVAAGCGSGTPPQLPLSAAGVGDERTAADSSMMVANIRYELADGVKVDTDKQDAFKLPTATREQATAVARAFGVAGDVNEDDFGWTIGGGGDEAVSDKSEVARSAHVSRSGSFSINGDQPVSSGVGCAAPDGADCAPPTTTTTPPNMPSEAEARATAESAMRSAGVDTVGMKVTVETFDLVRTVRFEATVDGMTVQGFEHQVAVTLDKKIAYASGYLGEPDSVGSYELATLERAVERLNNAGSWQPYPTGNDARAATEPAIAPDQSEPTIVKLTAARVGLMMSMDAAGGATWLTPAYVFTTDQPGEVVAAAAADKYFPPPTTQPPDTGKTEPGGSTEPMPSDGGGSSGNPGQAEPAPPSRNCARSEAPILAEVCTSASSYKAGDTVVFLISASDPDRAFTPGPCGDGVTAEYGDDGEGDARCLACSTTVADGPGKINPERKHTYSKAGTFTAKFTIKSGAECGEPHPNDSTVTLSLPVRVA